MLRIAGRTMLPGYSSNRAFILRDAANAAPQDEVSI